LPRSSISSNRHLAVPDVEHKYSPEFDLSRALHAQPEKRVTSAVSDGDAVSCASFLANMEFLKKSFKLINA
jgi:hypothetical protein